MRRVFVLAVFAFLSWPASGLTSPDSHAPHPEQDAHQAAYEAAVQAELAVISKTKVLLADKLEARAAEMKTRVRALYKLSRGSFPRLWIEPDERQRVSQWLGAARKITTRDKNELRLLQEEIDVAKLAETRLLAMQKQSLGHVIDADSLRSPLAKTRIVASYGEYKGPAKRVRLRRRGISMRAKLGEEVHAPAAGRVLYAGPISGLGKALILEHEGFVSIIGQVSPGELSIGDSVKSGAVIARTGALPLYFELRLTIGSVGHVIDPTDYLDR